MLIKCVCFKSVFVFQQEDVLVVTFFVTQEHGLLLQDSQPKPAALLSLLALDTPYYYYICKVHTAHLCFHVEHCRFQPFFISFIS